MGVNLICLPECAAFMGSTRQETVAAAEDIFPVVGPSSKPAMFVEKFKRILSNEVSPEQFRLESSSTYDGIEPINYVECLCLIAAKYQIWLSVGGFPEIVRSPTTNAPTGQIYNTHLIIDPSGVVVTPLYRKLHLFDSPLAGLKESELTAAGDRSVLLDNLFGQWKLGLSICYDLRFPLLYESFSSKGGRLYSIITKRLLILSYHRCYFWLECIWDFLLIGHIWVSL